MQGANLNYVEYLNISLGVWLGEWMGHTCARCWCRAMCAAAPSTQWGMYSECIPLCTVWGVQLMLVYIVLGVHLQHSLQPHWAHLDNAVGWQSPSWHVFLGHQQGVRWTVRNEMECRLGCRRQPK